MADSENWKTCIDTEASPRFDSWVNDKSGVGDEVRDRRESSQVRFQRVSFELAEALYASDPMARKIVDLLPAAATKDWIELDIPEEVEKYTTSALDRIKVRQKFRKGWEWGRLYGGAGLFISVKDNKDPSEPISFDSILSVQALIPLTKWELRILPQDINKDLTSANFGTPIFYNLTVNMGADVLTRRIHASRILRFDGIELPRHLHIQNGYWGEPVFGALINILRDFQLGHSSVATILQDCRLFWYKMKGLASSLGSDEDAAAVRRRLQELVSSKSTLGGLLLDGEDDIGFTDGIVTGVTELLDALKTWLQSGVDIPHTILWAESPSGTLGPTGNSEQADWFSYVKTQQESVCSSHLDYLLKLIFLSKDGPTRGKEPDGWSYTWRPLKEQSEPEKLDVREKQANVDRAYIEMGVLEPIEVRRSRFGGSNYSIETTIDRSLDPDESDEADQTELLEEPGTDSHQEQLS